MAFNPFAYERIQAGDDAITTLRNRRSENARTFQAFVDSRRQAGEEASPYELERMRFEISGGDNYMLGGLPSRDMIQEISNRSTQNAAEEQARSLSQRFTAIEEQQRVAENLVYNNLEADDGTLRGLFVETYGDEVGERTFNLMQPRLEEARQRGFAQELQRVNELGVMDSVQSRNELTARLQTLGISRFAQERTIGEYDRRQAAIAAQRAAAQRAAIVSAAADPALLGLYQTTPELRQTLLQHLAPGASPETLAEYTAILDSAGNRNALAQASQAIFSEGSPARALIEQYGAIEDVPNDMLLGVINNVFAGVGLDRVASLDEVPEGILNNTRILDYASGVQQYQDVRTRSAEVVEANLETILGDNSVLRSAVDGEGPDAYGLSDENVAAVEQIAAMVEDRTIIVPDQRTAIERIVADGLTVENAQERLRAAGLITTPNEYRDAAISRRIRENPLGTFAPNTSMQAEYEANLSATMRELREDLNTGATPEQAMANVRADAEAFQSLADRSRAIATGHSSDFAAEMIRAAEAEIARRSSTPMPPVRPTAGAAGVGSSGGITALPDTPPPPSVVLQPRTAPPRPGGQGGQSARVPNLAPTTEYRYAEEHVAVAVDIVSRVIAAAQQSGDIPDLGGVRNLVAENLGIDLTQEGNAELAMEITQEAINIVNSRAPLF